MIDPMSFGWRVSSPAKPHAKPGLQDYLGKTEPAPMLSMRDYFRSQETYPSIYGRDTPSWAQRSEALKRNSWTFSDLYWLTESKKSEVFSEEGDVFGPVRLREHGHDITIVDFVYLGKENVLVKLSAGSSERHEKRRRAGLRRAQAWLERKLHVPFKAYVLKRWGGAYWKYEVRPACDVAQYQVYDPLRKIGEPESR